MGSTSKKLGEELIVLLDDNFQEIGTAPKLQSHHADTPLHRAFSCYVFNDKGEFLVTQRARAKKVWPGVWTNSLCGHPAPGESYQAAIERRGREELGMKLTSIAVILPNYVYKTPPFRGIVEHEYCPVHVARCSSGPRPNSAEIEDYAWMTWQAYIDALVAQPGKYSYWAKDQLLYLRKHPLIQRYSMPNATPWVD